MRRYLRDGARMKEVELVYGDSWVRASVPDHCHTIGAGLSVPLAPAEDLGTAVRAAVEAPIDRPPLREQAHRGDTVTIAFDDATVPCYAPVWATAIPILIGELERAGVRRDDISLVCANSLHRKLRRAELTKLLGSEVMREHGDRIACHDAEDPDLMVDLGATASGYTVQLSRAVTDSDLTIYLNCSTMRGFSGGWKSVCVGLSGYRSINHHHTPDIMSMSLDRNRMHAVLDEMGSLVEERLGPERIFKIETVLANPLAVHDFYGGSVGATRTRVIETLKAHQPARRDLVDEPVDIVIYGVPDWSPYAAFSHTNPILDLISTGLGYLGGMIQAIGKPGCTVILATPCPLRWDETTHPSYREVWERVLPETRDPDRARIHYEPELARREDLIDRYRHGFGFHPVHGTMALYPLKRLRHAGRVIVAGPADPGVPRHCGFDPARTIEDAIAAAQEEHGGQASMAVVQIPPAFNRA